LRLAVVVTRLGLRLCRKVLAVKIWTVVVARAVDGVGVLTFGVGVIDANTLGVAVGFAVAAVAFVAAAEGVAKPVVG